VVRTFLLRDEIEVHAPIERCFRLSTSVELVQRELGMRPVGGRTTGLVASGDTVQWHGWQSGLPMFHVSLIDSFNSPIFFRDRMIAGRFATFEHEHNFVDRHNGTVLMSDELRFTMPFGKLCEFVGTALLAPHIGALMKRRFALLKRLAECDEWKMYLPETS